MGSKKNLHYFPQMQIDSQQLDVVKEVGRSSAVQTRMRKNSRLNENKWKFR